MLAAVTRSPGEMVVGDVTGPGRARAGHVIVRPERVGICGSDFHLFSGDVGALSGSRDFYPRIQGHEVAAIVADPGGSAHETNTRVAIWPLLPCGHCYPCRISRPNVCPAFRLVGVHLDGGLAERLEVPAGLVFGAGDLVKDVSVEIAIVPEGRRLLPDLTVEDNLRVGGRIRFSGLARELREQPELLSSAYLLRGSPTADPTGTTTGPLPGSPADPGTELIR